MHGERNERFAPHPCLQAISCSSIRPAHIFYPPLLGKIFCKLYYDKIRMIRLNPISMPTISPSTPGYGHQSGAFHLPRLAAGRGPTTDGNKENSAKFLSRLASPRLACTWRRRSSAPFLLLSLWVPIFPSWRSMSPLSTSTRRDPGRREAKTNLHSWVCIRWMSAREGGREKKRVSEEEGDRGEGGRGEEARRRGATEKREGNARIEATRPWQQQLLRSSLLYGVFQPPLSPKQCARARAIHIFT